MSLTNHNIEFEQRLTEELLDSIQISNTTNTYNELGLQCDEYTANDFRRNANGTDVSGYGYISTTSTNTNTYFGPNWIKWEQPTVAYSTCNPVMTTYVDGIMMIKLPELMELILKCIEKGVSPRILIDISEQIKKEGNVDIIITQLKEYLGENANSVDDFVDGLVDDIEKTVCGKKNE